LSNYNEVLFAAIQWGMCSVRYTCRCVCECVYTHTHTHTYILIYKQTCVIYHVYP
jgi:hypothetical protein